MAWLPLPEARLVLWPPTVSTRPPLRAVPPRVAMDWAATLFLAAAVLVLPPPRVIETPPVSRARADGAVAAPAASRARAAAGRRSLVARMGRGPSCLSL